MKIVCNLNFSLENGEYESTQIIKNWDAPEFKTMTPYQLRRAGQQIHLHIAHQLSALQVEIEGRNKLKNTIDSLIDIITEAETKP